MKLQTIVAIEQEKTLSHIFENGAIEMRLIVLRCSAEALLFWLISTIRLWLIFVLVLKLLRSTIWVLLCYVRNRYRTIYNALRRSSRKTERIKLRYFGWFELRYDLSKSTVLTRLKSGPTHKV